MKIETKKTLLNLAGSIIKNDSAIEGAKTAPWWIAVVLFVLGNFLPIIPIMVNASKTYGASFTANYTYGYDQALVTCGVQMKAQEYELNVSNKQLTVKKAGVELNNRWVEDADLEPIASYDTTINGVTQRSLNIFFTDRPTSGSGITVKKLVEVIESREYASGKNTIYNSEVDGETTTYVPSYLILYKTGMYSKIYKVNTKTAATSTYSNMDWDHVNEGNLLDYVMNVDVAQNVLDQNYVAAVMANWNKVFNASYQNQKIRQFWFTSGLYYGIYLLLGCFMALLMFLLTRGKNNPNRNLNYWITWKIDAWIIFTPAVLGMILGFVWSAAAGLGFIVLIGLRTMWLSMRQLSPMAQ